MQLSFSELGKRWKMGLVEGPGFGFLVLGIHNYGSLSHVTNQQSPPATITFGKITGMSERSTKRVMQYPSTARKKGKNNTACLYEARTITTDQQ
jgi:hypothetical protein